MDLLLGTWAARNIPLLSERELEQYEALLNRETLDLYNWVTGKEPPPPELQGPLIDGIVAFTRSQPLGRASPEVCLWGLGGRVRDNDAPAAPSACAQGYMNIKRSMSN